MSGVSSAEGETSVEDNFAAHIYRYDFLGMLVPGALTWSLIILLYWSADPLFHNIPRDLPSAVSAILVVAALFFFGAATQTIGSLIQPLLYRLWRGQPSSVILARRTGFMSEPLRHELSGQLRQWFAVPETEDTADLSHFLVRQCQALCIQHSLGREEEFNSKYAAMRNMAASCLVGLVSGLVVVILWVLGIVDVAAPAVLTWQVAFSCAGAVLFVTRARQRGYYWCREVLTQAQIFIRCNS